MTMYDVLFAAATTVAQAAAELLGGPEAAAEFSFLDEFLAGSPASVPHPAVDRLIAAAGLDDEARLLFLIIALVEELPRFGVLFETLQVSPGQHRPTLDLLTRLRPSARRVVRGLLDAGLVRMLNPEGPRSEAVLEIPGVLWDAIADGLAPTWARFTPPAQLRGLDRLHLSDALKARLGPLPAEPTTLLVRGPRHNGRGTLLGALARRESWGVLELELPPDDPRLALAGPLATALDAMLVLRLDPGHGGTARLGRPTAYDRHVGVVMPREGGLDGDLARRVLTFRRDLPGLVERTAQWTALLPEGDAPLFARTFRLTSGGIARAAELARTAALARDGLPVLADIREATRTLYRETLDQLATPLAGGGAWTDLVVPTAVKAELVQLKRRCEQRERLPAALGPALRELSPGVRALFAGPSGTGKTLAARVLAGELGMDIYRLDLGAVINKYIGETEKNLERVFSRAEELDVVLLLDEGDALMSRRTAVASANDRYANLETNFLLQRLETFTGIVIVTTNAADRIDPAFARRMDVVVEFPVPDVGEREQLWRLHLPDGHAVSPAALADLAERCSLTGAQIRNAAIYAALLKLPDTIPAEPEEPAGLPRPGLAELRQAIDREFRKLGVPSPFGGR